MFKCEYEFCKQITKPNQPVNWLITEWRKVQYINRTKSQGRNRWEETESEGKEIVKQIRVCPKCFKKLTGKQPKMSTPKLTPLNLNESVNEPVTRPKKWKGPKKYNKKRKDKDDIPEKRVVVEIVNPIPIIK